jgi:ATP phosphoribosyltransferase regulatory subunit
MYYLPDGVQDFMPDEYRLKHHIEEKLRDTFIKCGYKEVMPPTFEFYENFTGSAKLFDENNLYRFFDKKGNILTLRPDVTTQIARIAATKCEGVFPLKFCYVANAYRYEDPQVGKMREFTQAGIELIGVNREISDAECISVAVESLKKIGLKDFKVDIGQAEFFEAVLEELNLDGLKSHRLKELLEQKNQSGIEEFLCVNHITGANYRLISELPLLFGNYDVIEKAKEIYKTEKTIKALKYLENVYEILKDYGMHDYIMFDLGMVQRINYYTGLIFRCFVKGIGYAICAGGRYDNLLKNFGKDMPATGFAISIERVMLALQKQGVRFDNEPSRICIVYSNGSREKAYKYALSLRDEGNIVELSERNNEVFCREKYDKIIEIGD